MHNKGFVYVVSLGVAVLVTMASASLLMRSISENAISERSNHRSTALHLAESGIDQVLINLRTNNTSAIPATSLSEGTFWAEVSPITGTETDLVTAHGLLASEQRNIEAVIRRIPESIFEFALFGANGVNVSGNAITDSYDSRSGPYSEESNSAHNGDVGTNSASPGGVTVGGSIFVDGQVAVGPDVANPLSVVSGYDPAFITGGTYPPSDTQDVMSQSSEFPIPNITVPAGMTCSDYTVTGGTTLFLSPTGGPLGDGTYCYHDLTVQGSAKLTSTGNVTVYLTGSLIARGNSEIGYADDPRRMTLLMTSNDEVTMEEGTITGSTKFYGALYGPKATMNITGNAEVFGSIIAKTVNLTGSAVIHYDEALTDQTKISNRFRTSVISWREI